MTERELQQAVVEAAARFGWLTYHTYDSRRSNRGFPDLVMVKGQRTLFVELKSDKGQLRLEQKEWLARLILAHQETFVWRPEDWTNGTIIKVLR